MKNRYLIPLKFLGISSTIQNKPVGAIVIITKTTYRKSQINITKDSFYGNPRRPHVVMVENDERSVKFPHDNGI